MSNNFHTPLVDGPSKIVNAALFEGPLGELDAAIWSETQKVRAETLSRLAGSGNVQSLNIFNVLDPSYGAAGDGIQDDTAAIQAAINAAVGVGYVYLTGIFRVTASLSLPAGTRLVGVNQGGNDSSKYGATILFEPSAPGDTLFETPFVADYIQAAEIHNMAIVAVNSNAAVGVNFTGVLGGVIDGVLLRGPFTTAGLIVDGCANCQFDHVNITNVDTATAMPAGILLRTTQSGLLGTTCFFSDIYVHGVLGTSGGITAGVVCEDDSSNSATFRNCIFESLAQNAFKIDKGNTFTVLEVYVENVPNSNVDKGIFEIGLTTAGAARNTHVNIIGGTVAGPSTHGNVALIDADNVDSLNVMGLVFSQVGRVIDHPAKTDAKLNFLNCYHAGTLSTFGTLGTTNTLYLPEGSTFDKFPTEHRDAGTWAKVGSGDLRVGRSYFATDHETNGAPRFWNGSAWVNALGSTVLTGGANTLALAVQNAADPTLQMHSGAPATAGLKLWYDTSEDDVYLDSYYNNAAARFLFRLRVAGTPVNALTVTGAGKVLASGGIGVGNSAAGSSLGSVVRKMEVFDAAGNSLGFVPIYNTIT